MFSKVDLLCVTLLTSGIVFNFSSQNICCSPLFPSHFLSPHLDVLEKLKNEGKMTKASFSGVSARVKSQSFSLVVTHLTATSPKLSYDALLKQNFIKYGSKFMPKLLFCSTQGTLRSLGENFALRLSNLVWAQLLTFGLTENNRPAMRPHAAGSWPRTCCFCGVLGRGKRKGNKAKVLLEKKSFSTASSRSVIWRLCDGILGRHLH